MELIEIFTIILIILIVGSILSYFIYKKVKGEKIDECSCHLTSKSLVKAYHKKYKKSK